MKGFLFYRIGTYLLLFVAGFWAMSVLLYLPMAFANPSILLVVFLLACVIIYSYTSYRFMTKGMIGQMTFKKSFRDLVKVNGYGSLVVAVIILIESLVLFQNYNTLLESIEEILDLNGFDMDPQYVLNVIKKFFIVLGIYSVILIIHIFATFRLLKKNAYLFDERA